MKTSIKLIYTSFFLCLALLLTGFTATSTIQAYQEFQQNHQRVQHGDATTVSSWMTIPYVSNLYNVPEPCFTQTLQLNDRWLMQHATLRVLADHYQRPVEKMIHDVESVILKYRRKELACGPALQTTRAQSPPVHAFSVRKGQAR